MYRKTLRKVCIILSIIVLVLLPTVALAVDYPIIIDCNFDDWEDKPHTPLTKGKVTNSGSLFLDGENLYVHIKINDSTSNDFPDTPMTLTINDTNKYKMKFVIRPINPDNTMGGHLNNLPEGNNLNLAVFYNNSNSWLGNAGIKVFDNQHRTGDEAEFNINLEKLVGLFENISIDELRTFTLSCPNIGKEDLTITGTSTAPFIGIAVTLVVVGLVVLFRKYKKTVA